MATKPKPPKTPAKKPKAPAPVPVPVEQRGEEIYLSPEDEIILDRVWDEIGRQERKKKA
jgi:hypothetical protein